MKVEVVPIDELRDDPLNPRRTVDERLDAVASSLSRFGHVLPIVVDEDGYLASGHQRTKAAKMLGATQVPVLRIPTGDNLYRAGRLMLFNLATNDTPDRKALTRLFEGVDLAGMMSKLNKLPAIDIDDPERWPCMVIEDVDLGELIEVNGIAVAEEGFEGPRALARPPYNICLPVVATADRKIVSGRQRLVAATVLERKTWPVVTVAGKHELMALALNKLSMEYDLSGFGDVFRASVWLNHNRQRTRLGIGFTHWVHKGASIGFDITDPDSAKLWRKTHGGYVADLGAGHMIETGLLNQNGIRSVAFEPFLIDGAAKPNRDNTRKMVRVFLAEIAEGRSFDSVFISAVLNQVPFEVDRFRLLTLAHTLSAPNTATFITTQSRSASEWNYFEQGRENSRHRDFDLRVPGPEDATVLSSIALGRVMVTKYHTADELKHLCGQLWGNVEIESSGSSHFVRCTAPKPMRLGLVRRMIEHEFDLPWGDGERLGMTAEALAAFERRLGVDIPALV